MKFGHLEIFVSDPLKAKDFYEKILGFEVVAIQGEKHVWLKLGNSEILLRPGKPPKAASSYQQTNIAMVLYTDNLPQAIKRLESKGLVFSGTDGSPNCPTFKDPDGNWFQLVDPGDH